MNVEITPALHTSIVEARRQVKQFLGDRYDQEIQTWKTVVTGRMQLRDYSPFKAASELYMTPGLHNDMAMQFLFTAVLELEEEKTASWKCQFCGCTDKDCHQCIEAQGHACHWIGVNLCSRCAAEHIEEGFEGLETVVGNPPV